MMIDPVAPATAMPLGIQIVWLAVLAAPVACVAWTVTHEDLLRELREYAIRRSKGDRYWYERKFFYMLTCEYCFSHYVALFFLLISRFQLLLDGWRGYLIAWLALVWLANQYMSVFNRLRLDIKDEAISIAVKEEQLEATSSGPERP